MMGKISSGGSCGGCVDYVTRKKKDNPGGSSSADWRMIDSKDVATYGGREEIVASFEDNFALNPRIKNPVGHISLNFHANDKDKIDDKTMVEIAGKYMERMGISDTPYILVRHLDKDYPHCHLVFSRVDNHGETISDRNDRLRNRDVCLSLTKEYGLYISEGKKHTNVNRLRGSEKVRYEIFNAVESVYTDPSVSTMEQFEQQLRAKGVGMEYKYRHGTSEVQGLWYTMKGKRFPASKIDRRFSIGNVRKHISQHKPLHPQSKWMYADGLIVPITNFRGVRLTASQQSAYSAGKTVRLDGCRGETGPVFILFNREKMSPVFTRTNPNVQSQSSGCTTSSEGNHSHSMHPSQGPTDEGQCTVSGGSGETWPEFRARHPEMTPKQALDAWRAKLRGRNLNGGFSMGGHGI